MVETLSVSISGPALSLLIYETLKSSYGQEGFLLGETFKNETKTITDSAQRQVNVQRIIKVTAAVPCPQLNYFYDGIGRVNSEKIDKFLGNQRSKVVAWYKYKPLSSFKFTFRENLVHRQLAQIFQIPHEYFSCCLLINESSDNSSTHLYRQNVIRYNNLSYDQLQLQVINLNNSKNSCRNFEPISDTFNKILNDLNINYKKTQGLTVIKKIHNALQKHTDSVIEELSKAEERLFQLENEIDLKKSGQKCSDNNNSNLAEEHLNEAPAVGDEIIPENCKNKTIKERGAKGKKKGVQKTKSNLNVDVQDGEIKNKLRKQLSK